MMIRALAPALLLFATTLAGQARTPGHSNSTADTETTPMRLDGALLVEKLNGSRRTLTDANTARSGDRLIFFVRYHNRASHSLPGYDIVVPVPDGVRILADRHDMVRVSADGGHSWFMPGDSLRFDRTGHLRPAREAQATHVRLRLADTIPAYARGTVSYRGQLL